MNMPNAASAKPLGVMSVHRPCLGRVSSCRGGAIPGRKEAVAMLVPMTGLLFQ